MDYRQVLEPFIQRMIEILEYGYSKHGETSVQARILAGSLDRFERVSKENIIQHIKGHADEYLEGIRHDHFYTLGHQLVASAVNAFMEFYFAQLSTELNVQDISELTNRLKTLSETGAVDVTHKLEFDNGKPIVVGYLDQKQVVSVDAHVFLDMLRSK